MSTDQKTTPRQMKIYVAHNIDGVNRAMVSAQNLVEAAKRMRTSVYQLRQYGWHEATVDQRADYMAMLHNHTVYRPIDHFPPFTFWRVKPWVTSEVQAARQKRRAAVENAS